MPSFTVTSHKQDDAITLALTGRMEIKDAAALWGLLEEQTGPQTPPVSPPVERWEFDLSGLERLDGACVALLHASQKALLDRGEQCHIVNANAETQRLLELYAGEEVCPKAPPCSPGLLFQVGAATLEVFHNLRDVFRFVGALTHAVARGIRNPRSLQWSDVPALMEKAGADSIPIVILINFLIGLVLGLQSALQLEQFGVGIYVADLVGKSVTRELGPLMTAIIAAGRSGAAYAAEIGTMKVSEEIDALQTLGFDPLRTLVLPRLIALALMLPLLVLIGDFVGCVGGFVVGVTVLDLTPVSYVQQTQSSVVLWDVWGGLIKASVFGVTIALISCQRGLSTRGGAAGVGVSTTSAVVAILFFLVSIDAVFAVIYASLGI